MESKNKKGKRVKEDKHAKKSNSSVKKTIVQIIAIIAIAILIIFATQHVLREIEIKEAIEQQEIENKEREENVKRLSQSRTYKDLSIDNINMYEKYGNTYFTAEVENKAKTEFKAKDIVIDFLDKEGNSIIKFGYRINNIKAGEKKEIQIITNQDLTKAYDFIIEE